MYKTFSQWLIEYMDGYGVSGTRLCIDVDVERETVSRWRSGKRRPRRKMVIKIANALRRHCSATEYKQMVDRLLLGAGYKQEYFTQPKELNLRAKRADYFTGRKRELQ